MTYVLVMHKVEDYDKWKSSYDDFGAMRKAYGSKGAFVFNNSNDPIVLLLIIKSPAPRASIIDLGKGSTLEVNI